MMAEKQDRKKMTPVLTAVLVLVLFAALAGGLAVQFLPESPEAEAVEETVQTEPATGAYVEPEHETIEISTPYGPLKFPGKWEQYLQTNVIEGEIYIVEFYANVKDYPQQHLFNVLIGPDIVSEFQMPQTSGKKYFLEIEYLLPEVDDTWEPEDADILYGMIEGINYLVD